MKNQSFDFGKNQQLTTGSSKSNRFL